jgi:hypothetical protein
MKQDRIDIAALAAFANVSAANMDRLMDAFADWIEGIEPVKITIHIEDEL